MGAGTAHRKAGQPTLDDIRAAANDVAAPTLEQIRAWPAVVTVERACQALGFSRSHGYMLIKLGQFPARVIEAGGRRVVVTASLLTLLSAAA